jgi:putative ABC transport system substrate-binding protein
MPVNAVLRRNVLRRAAGLGIGATGLVLLNGCGILLPSAGHPARVPRVGYVGDSGPMPWAIVLWDSLRERGWVEGENLTIERRYSQTQSELLARVAELVALPVDVLVTVGTPTTLVAKQATATIPIVFTPVRDPVGVEIVASLARPGGNVTGVSQGASGSYNGKQLELLKGLVPWLIHVAVIFYSNNPVAKALAWPEIQEAAGVLGVEVQALDVGSADDLASAFAAAADWPAHGVIVRGGDLILTERARIVELAAGIHLPAIYQSTEFVDADGLMSYGTSQRNTNRRAAIYIDKILRGARPADLPIEQLTTVEFAVNVKTAQALGLTIPPDVAAQVTEWVQ